MFNLYSLCANKQKVVINHQIDENKKMGDDYDTP